MGMKKLYFLLLFIFFGIFTSYAQTIDETFVNPVPYKAARITVTKELPDGRILLGGVIEFYKDKAVNNLVRLNADYSLDETFLFNDENKLEIKKVELQSNGDIVVLANVTNLYNIAFEKATIFLLDNSGAIKSKISDLDDVSGIAVQSDNKILISSGHVSIDRGYVRRYNSDLTLDETFINDIIFDKIVSGVKVFGDKIYVNGLFSKVNGVAKNSIARLNLDGTIDASFDVGEGAKSEFGMTIQEDGKIIVGGNFKRIVNSEDAYNLARLNSDGSLDTAFLSQFYSYPTSDILVKDSFIYIKTWLSDVDAPGYYLVSLKANGTLNKNFAPLKLNEYMSYNFALNSIGEKIFYSDSEFTGNKYGLSIADFNGNTLDSSELKPNRLGSFETGGLFDGKLVVKGDFVKVNNVETFGIALLDENGAVDNSFIFPKYLGAIKESQIIDNSTIFVSTKDLFVKLDNKGIVLKNFDYKKDSQLLGIQQFKVLENGKILITDQWGLYLLNEDGVQEISFNLNSNPYYWTTAVNFGMQNDKIICSAQIEKGGLGFLPETKIFRFNLDGSIDESFNIGTTNSAVSKIKVLESGDIIVAGAFNKYNGIDTPYQFLKISKDGVVNTDFLDNLEIQKIGISGGEYFDYRKIEEIDSVIYVTQGESKISALYLDGKPKFDFEMPVTLESITDIIPLEETAEGNSPTSRKATSTNNESNYMFAIGSVAKTSGNVSSVIIKINLGKSSGSLGLDPVNEDVNSKIKVYPIPAQEKINVEFSNTAVPTKVEVYSLNGAKVYSSAVKSTDTFEVDMSKFASGVYFVKLYSDAGVTTKKIIKK